MMYSMQVTVEVVPISSSSPTVRTRTVTVTVLWCMIYGNKQARAGIYEHQLLAIRCRQGEMGSNRGREGLL